MVHHPDTTAGLSRREMMKRSLKAGGYIAPVLLASTVPITRVAAATPPISTFSFASPVTYSVDRAFDVAVGDLNGDGKPDLVVVGLFGGAAVLLNQGNGTFAPGGMYPATMGNTYLVALGDFNRDGRLDVALGGSLGGQSGGLITVFLGNGNGTFVLKADYRVGALSGIGVGDFNGDGKPDLVGTYFDKGHGLFSVSTLLGNGDGTFGAGAGAFAGALASVVVADFNGDGTPDIAGTSLQRESFDAPIDAVGVLFGNGGGGFATPVIYPVGFLLNGIAVGDFNRDGRPDIVVVGDGGVAVLLNTGGGIFAVPIIYSAGNQPTGVAVADFNRDGNLDLAVTNNGGGTVSILPGRGNGTFGAPVNFPIGTAPERLAVGDFNGDGKPDIVVTSSTTGSVFVLLNSTL
ncbi:MAG: FG-GAP repeat domain-containing protein [Thermomicrobiales bacterium]